MYDLDSHKSNHFDLGKNARNSQIFFLGVIICDSRRKYLLGLLRLREVCR